MHKFTCAEEGYKASHRETLMNGGAGVLWINGNLLRVLRGDISYS